MILRGSRGRPISHSPSDSVSQVACEDGSGEPDLIDPPEAEVVQRGGCRRHAEYVRVDLSRERVRTIEVTAQSASSLTCLPEVAWTLSAP